MTFRQCVRTFRQLLRQVGDRFPPLAKQDAGQCGVEIARRGTAQCLGVFQNLRLIGSQLMKPDRCAPCTVLCLHGGHGALAQQLDAQLPFLFPYAGIAEIFQQKDG